jgi:phenylacetate-CoA ligase
MYSTILKNVIYPFYQRKLPQDQRTIPYLKLLNKTQWWKYSDLEEFQLKKVKLLLHHADRNVPYYHKIFKKLNFQPDDIKNVNELKRLPILTKEIIRDNFEDLYARNYSKYDLISSATSGSTGTPMKFFIDRKWRACNDAAAFRSWSFSGFELGDKMAYLWGALQDLKDQNKILNKIRYKSLRVIKLNTFDLTQETMQNYIQILRKYKPKAINSYASAAYIMSQYMEKREINDIKPEAILTTADMLYDYRRKSIAKVFGCDVFDYYSGRDTSLQAAECPEHTGYHLSIENAVVEFVKENESVAFGETGKIILTDLCNYAMPFIRYEIGDLGVPTDENCPCGRNLPIMKSLKGRILDIIITPEGKLLTGEFFPGIFAFCNIKGFEEYQIIQKRRDELLIKLIKGKNFNNTEFDSFIDIIKKNVGKQMNIEVQFVDKIESTKSGKRRHVISEIDGNQIKIQ